MTEFPTMQGNARVATGAGEFTVPLFTHVIDNLWQGCSPAEFPDPGSLSTAEMKEIIFFGRSPSTKIQCKWLMDGEKPRFDAILNLYQWGEYAIPEGTEQLTIEMYDSLEAVSEQVDELAKQVIQWLDDGKKVLVHCQAGLNRSSLIVARVLMMKYKMKAHEAILKIREQRSPTCLCNSAFVEYLLNL